MCKRIVAIVGDYYHRSEPIVESLEQSLKDHFGRDEVVIETSTVDELALCLGTNPDAVILAKENRLNPEASKVDNWLNPTLEKLICDYVKQGGGWISWHSGLASYTDNKALLEMTHGHFIHHPEAHQLVRYRVVSKENLMDSSYDFAILDEHYFVQCDEEQTSVFLRSESVDGASIAGWHHSYGEGRVVCLTPAHLKEGLLHPSMTRMLAQVMKWGLKLV